MWIVLLDHSSSMGDPFEASDDSSRRTRVVDVESKLEAAKEVLREEIRELKDIDASMVVAIFAFTDAAKLVYDGPVSDLQAIERVLGTLNPHNGTDIAAALNAAADYKEALAHSSLSQLVLISDGKSDRMEAMAAARRCVERQLALSMLLIDPTEEGKTFARDVVRGVGGTYQPVMSSEDLREATKDVSKTYSANRARAERYLETAKGEAHSIEEEVANRDRVKFTSGYPGRIMPRHDYLLRVYVHIETQLQEVLKRLEQDSEQFGGYPRKGDAESNQRIPVGTRLEVTPRINFISANPPQQRVTWTGAIEELSFRVYYVGTEQTPIPPCSGFIDISTGGLLLAQIPVSIQIEAGESRVQPRTVEMISRVFASYSHKDERIIRACKATYRALGIQLFVDKDDILSGQIWRDVLRRSIADHDLFQLFWSEAAANSDEVANEWRLAKEIASARTSDFIRPLYWADPMPQPPNELSHLNFSRLDTGALQVNQSETGMARPVSTASLEVRLKASFPIIETVDSGSSWVPWLQERMAEVVPFLEDLLGVRYFPPVTFLVDEHVVQATREVLTTDSSGDGEDALEPVLKILQALALGFHVGKLVDPEMGCDQRAAFFEAYSNESRADYDHVVHMAEWVFARPIRDHLAGKDFLGQARKSLKELLEATVNGGSGYDAAELVRQTLERASPAEQAAQSNAVTPKVLEGLKSFNDSEKKAAALRLLASDLPRLADQYGVFEFFHRTAPHSLRHHQTFPTYLADLVRHWLGYIKIAKAKRPDAVIDVGYSIPESAMQWLQRTMPDIEILITRTAPGWRDDVLQVYLEMPINSYEGCAKQLSAMLLSILSKGHGGWITELLNTAVSTHGIYMPAFVPRAEGQLIQFLSQRGWPENAALPGQHKVLLCMGAVDRFQDELVKTGWDENKARELAQRFSLSILIHEHFHAAVATGLDQMGRAALGIEHPKRWETAGPLNESLAVWCEKQFFRNDPTMLQRIDTYIANGTYPSWPYRGGEIIESVYTTGGTPAVRGWMRYLRDDPENAQREFDQRALPAYS
ncbi:TIR domain-containing protein [Nitrospira sp. Nam80]